VVDNHTAAYLESMTMALEGCFQADDRLAAIIAGAAIQIPPVFDAETLLRLIEREQITQIFGLPMMFRAMLDHPTIGERDLRSFRRALYAMVPMPQETLIRCLEVFDCDFNLLFGQTELSPTATIFRPEHQLSHPGAAGTPVVIIDSVPRTSTGKIQKNLIRDGHVGHYDRRADAE